MRVRYNWHDIVEMRKHWAIQRGVPLISQRKLRCGDIAMELIIISYSPAHRDLTDPLASAWEGLRGAARRARSFSARQAVDADPGAG